MIEVELVRWFLLYWCLLGLPAFALLHHRRRGLAAALMEAYLRRSGDWEVRPLQEYCA